MVSHKQKCIFVHIPKTAGTSIEMLINQTPFSGTTHELLKFEHARTQNILRNISNLHLLEILLKGFTVYLTIMPKGKYKKKQHPSSIKQWVLHSYIEK